MQYHKYFSFLAKALFVVVLLTFSEIRATPPSVIDPGYVLKQKIALTKKLDGVDAFIEIWRDKRTVPVKPAVIVFNSTRLNNSKNILTLEKPDATINVQYTDGLHKRIFLITQNFKSEFGSYNGPITQLLEIHENSIAWASAFAKNSRKSDQIILTRSLKSAWNFDRKTNDILQVRCLPNESFDGFITYFSRFHFGKQGWILTTRNEPILWEAEDGDRELGVSLPNLKKFP